MSLIEYTPNGLYCQQADVYIDPIRAVDKAIITHAHADHARWGSKYYLANEISEHVMRLRLGKDINLETISYNKTININGVKVSLHPAGHIPGSSQIRLEYKDEIWVITGDYKTEDDGLSTPFEPVKCTHIVTESTFGLPIYNWKSQKEIFEEINQWWNKNAKENKCSVLVGYSLGKAQRLLNGLDQSIGKVLVHSTIYETNEALQKSGVQLSNYHKIDKSVQAEDIKKAMIICTPNAMNDNTLNKFEPYEIAYCSGWMALRGAKNRMPIDRGFVISDHADWKGLNFAIKESQAENVYVTHGYNAVFARWLREQGINGMELNTLFDRIE